jgi:hypothetical protein
MNNYSTLQKKKLNGNIETQRKKKLKELIQYNL